MPIVEVKPKIVPEIGFFANRKLQDDDFVLFLIKDTEIKLHLFSLLILFCQSYSF